MWTSSFWSIREGFGQYFPLGLLHLPGMFKVRYLYVMPPTDTCRTVAIPLPRNSSLIQSKDPISTLSVNETISEGSIFFATHVETLSEALTSPHSIESTMLNISLARSAPRCLARKTATMNTRAKCTVTFTIQHGSLRSATDVKPRSSNNLLKYSEMVRTSTGTRSAT